MRRGDRLLLGYVGLVSVLGLATLAILIPRTPFDVVDAHWPQVLVLTALTVLGELRPVRLARRQGASGGAQLTTSAAFGFAILVMAGPAVAAGSLALSTVVADIHARKQWYKATYNVGQYILSIAASALVLGWLSNTEVLLDGGRVRADDVLPLIAACATFVVVNSTFVGVVVSLAKRTSVLGGVWDELSLQAVADSLLLGLAPVMVVVAVHNLALSPFLVLPVAAVHMSLRASLEKELQALHDALTGLPNRVLFRDSATEGLAAAGDAMSAVMLLDLDRFKEINDTLGHHIGDLLLKEVGSRIGESVRSDDMVARLGGDEFAIFIGNVESAEIALQIAGQVRTALAEPFVVEDLFLHVDGSVGIALAPDHGSDIDTLLQRADVAMYVAKDTHSGSRLYTPDDDPHSRRRLKLLSDLRTGLEQHDLILHYQPKADFRTGRISDVEALVRWIHPELGLVPPNDFIPLAERSGLIGPLTEYVLLEAITRAADWRTRGIDLRVSVNLSVRSLMDLELPSRISAMLAAAGLPAAFLELEITESTVMADPVRAMSVLQPLSDMGVRLSIDDFGTGYSSLAYLRQLPISELKIDRSFVSAMTTSENDAVIVRSTIEMAKNLGLETVAEGVETPEEEAALRRLGCEYLQGYLLSRPLPAEELEAALPDLAARWKSMAAVEGVVGS